MHAETLNCGSCGGVVSRETLVCAHCGANVAAMACPGCFQMMPAGSKFCPNCGGSAVAWKPAEHPLECPGCRGTLALGQAGPFQIYQCGRCHGFWIDKATFAEICRRAEEQQSWPGLSEVNPPSLRAAELTVRYVRCPECQILMNRVNFAQYSGVVIDVCREHGTWFDVNELQRIVTFIRDGGMNRIREKQVELLKSEQRRLQRERASREPQPFAFTAPVGSNAQPLWDILQTVRRLLR